ncbi:MAG: ABC-type multidrug transport system [Candidatus Alkanophagales archaeon MCA70_species_1]|nr:ABC-type multidrug transport system [Candidatus Alkanophaga volatiphilum]
MSKFWSKVWAITEKDILMYYSKGPVVIFGVLFPVFLFLAFYVGRELPASFLIPGLLSMTLFFTATSVPPVIAPWEGQTKTLERLLSCPISVEMMILGDVLASFIFCVCLSAVPVVVGVFAGVGVKKPVILTVATLLGALCFSCFGLLFSAYPTNLPSNVMMLSTLVKFPIVFISGIFIPVENLPHWGVVVASLSPLTYFTDLARLSIQGYAFYPVYLDFLVLFACTALFLLIATKLHKRALPKRL